MRKVKNMAYADLLALARRGDVRARTHTGAVRAPGTCDARPWPPFVPPASGDPDAESRDVFVALPPATVNGDHAAPGTGGEGHVPAAVKAGAAFVLCRPEYLDSIGTLLSEFLVNGESCRFLPVFVEHPSPRHALGELAAAEFRTRDDAPRLIGVTGTNGKTTSSYLLECILAGNPCISVGVLGTVEYRWPGHHEDAPLTTPGCLDIHSMLRAMRNAGTQAAIMEISSHALDQERVAGLTFDGALFTNLTQDHLDYHPDMEHYYQAKSRLFRRERQGGYPLDGKAMAINYDDEYGRRLYTECATTSRHIAYGLGRGPKHHLRGTILEQGPAGLVLRMEYGGSVWDLRSPLVGEFNAYNLLGAQAMGLALGFSSGDFSVLEGFKGVPGRLERVTDQEEFSVFVDYAHTPDALEKALLALRGAGFKRIVTVFGCGGDRDRAKRPKMGAAAARHSDAVVLTSDNPRTEDPLAIMADARPGLASCPLVMENPDRKEAIAQAVALLRPGDALLVAGKGHESYQVIGTTKYPFSDREAVREVLGCV